MRKKKDEVVTVKAIVNLNDVMFEPDALYSGIYKMTLPTGWGFSIQTEVTAETKEEIERQIERYIAKGIDNNENKR